MPYVRKDHKWPQPPDPRAGHFCTRGFDPPIAGPFKIGLKTSGATGLMSFMNTGVVTQVYYESWDRITYAWDSNDPDPFKIRFILDLYLFQEPQASIQGYSVNVGLIIWETDIQYYQGNFTLLWTNNRSPWGTMVVTPYLVGLNHIPNPIDVIPLDWNEPVIPTNHSFP